jgi:hypothetical protein
MQTLSWLLSWRRVGVPTSFLPLEFMSASLHFTFKYKKAQRQLLKTSKYRSQVQRQIRNLCFQEILLHRFFQTRVMRKSTVQTTAQLIPTNRRTNTLESLWHPPSAATDCLYIFLTPKLQAQIQQLLLPCDSASGNHFLSEPQALDVTQRTIIRPQRKRKKRLAILQLHQTWLQMC